MQVCVGKTMIIALTGTWVKNVHVYNGESHLVYTSIPMSMTAQKPKKVLSHTK